MNAYTKAVLSAMVLLGAGCGDPYNSEPSGPPKIVGAGVTVAGSAVEAAPSGSAWTATPVPASCSGTTALVAAPFIYVKMNKLLDGLTVQKSPTDCSPAGNWLTVTETPPPAVAPTDVWYACYNPGSPTPTEGGSIFIFRAPPAPVASGWISASDVEASTTVATTYRAVGRVFDKSGNGVDIDVTANVPPITCP